MTKIVIVGAGTAGLISAAYFTNTFQNASVELYYNGKNRSIGVGEGTADGFSNFLTNVLNIPASEFLKHVESSVKLGINFKDWLPNSEYYHGFEVTDKTFDMNNYSSLIEILSDNYKGGKNFNDATNTIPDIPFDDYRIAYHIDTKSFSDYLFKLLETKVKFVQDIITDVNVENNNIKSIKGRKSGIITADLFVDCSGLNKRLIKHLDAKWEDLSDTFIINSAIPYQFNHNYDEIPSYTLSQATQDGWIWQIPFAERYGTGYLYSDKFTMEHDAKYRFCDWLDNKHDEDPTLNNTIKWDAGYYKESWVGNCLSIGLSSGFIEPMEATNISMILSQLEAFYEVNYTLSGISYNRDSYNKIVNDAQELMTEVISLHYCTNRTDSDFWRYMTNNKTDWVLSFEEKLKEEYYMGVEGMYAEDLDDLLQIAMGLNMINKDAIIKCITLRNDGKHLMEQSKEHSNYFTKCKEYNWVSHKHVLKTLREVS
tara:strand:- start:904 stop:2352 length:1449 start_codon:yes stop_codon:yes gene_type:complete